MYQRSLPPLSQLFTTDRKCNLVREEVFVGDRLRAVVWQRLDCLSQRCHRPDLWWRPGLLTVSTHHRRGLEERLKRRYPPHQPVRVEHEARMEWANVELHDC